MWIRIDILEPPRGAEFAKRLRQIEEFCADLAVPPRAGAIFQIDAVGRGVLRNDQQLLDPGVDQFLRLAQHVIGLPRDQIATQFWDDAEAATIVATL